MKISKKNIERLDNNKVIAISFETTNSCENTTNKINADYQKLISLSAIKLEKEQENENKHIKILPVENFNMKGFYRFYTDDKKKVVSVIPDAIYKVNGLNNEKVDNEEPFFKYAKNIYQFIKNNPQDKPTYLLSFSPYIFDIHILKNEMDYAKENNKHITDGIYNPLTFRKDIKYIDIRSIYLHYEKENNNVKTIDDLFELYFPAEEVVLFKQIRLCDKLDILKEKQKELYNINSDSQYFEYALSKKENFYIDKLPVLIHYYFNGSSLKDIYTFYTGKKFEQPKDEPYYKVECYIEIFFNQLKKYKIDIMEAYKISTLDMVDWDKQLILTDDKHLALNFGKYKGKLVDDILKTDSDYILGYMMNKNKNTGLFNYKKDTINLLKRYIKNRNKQNGTT